MLQPIIQALKKQCNNKKENLHYYAEYAINSPNIHLSVEGIGKIGFPLNQDTIHQLLHVSEQAQFGWRDQTLTDKAVRDTQEISSRYLQVDLESDFLKSILNETKQQLGLPDHARLSAHLHNLLIYGPGQFFKSHRDSEKLDGMLATLVIVLPSPHIGGDLLINHKKEQHRFISENINQTGLNCIAFYADCYHEVEKITQGYRVALTYNVVLQSTNRRDESPENIALDVALKNYFESPEMNYSDINLIYFLDHSYTEHSLRWDLLKGNDYYHAHSFLQAAKKLDLVPHLALVEIHKSWTTDGDDGSPLHEELIDDSTCLNYWVDEHNQSLVYQHYLVNEDEVCWLTATEDLDPDKTEHEGWMGNYGNTVDYWYRRAAIVLWPKQAQIRMDFRLNHDKAIQRIFQLIQIKGHEQEIVHVIQQVNEYFHQANSSESTSQLEQYLQLALYIKNADTALFVLTNYPLYILDVTHNTLLLALQQQYGIEWCLLLLEQWKNKATSSYRENVLIKNLSQLTAALTLAELNTKIIEFLIEYQFSTLIQYNEQWKHARPVKLKESFHLRLDILNDIFQASISLNNILFTQQLIQYIVSNTQLYPAIELAPFLIKWKETTCVQTASWYESLFTHVTTAIQKELSKGLRSEQDTSINQCLACNCVHCKSTNDFLQSPTESIKVWAVRQDIRQHIMNAFSGLGLPVNLTEERKGSPYKLIIKKDENLFEIAKTRFTTLNIYQSKLGTATQAAFHT